MTANEVIALAKAGELRQLSTAIKDDTTVLLGFLNLGIIEIYKRFVLKTQEALVTLVDGKTVYTLDGTDPDVDMGGGTFFYLIAAYGDSTDSDYSMDDLVLPINVEDDIYSINTITYNQIQIPLATPGAFISLIYADKPTKVTTATLDNELEMPDQFVDALLAYMGYRGYRSMGDKGASEDNIYFSEFEKACLKIKELGVGIAPDDVEMNMRLQKRCFV